MCLIKREGSWKLSFMVNIHFKAAQSFFLGQHALNKVSEIVNYLKRKEEKRLA